MAAPVVTLLGTSVFDTTTGTHTVTATPTVGDLIAIVVANDGFTAGSTVTDNNSGGAGAFTRICSALKATSADLLELHIRTALVVSGTSTIFSATGASSTGGGITVYRITNMTRLGAAGARCFGTQANQASGGTPAPVLSLLPSTTNPIITAVFNATNVGGVTARASPAYTRDTNLGHATPTEGMCVAHVNGSETTATITWGGTSASAFCSLAVEINGISTFTQAMTATLSFIGAFTKFTSISKTGALSFIGALVKLAVTSKTATLSFVGALVKCPWPRKTAALSFIGASSKCVCAKKTAALSFIGARNDITRIIKSASLALSGTVSKLTRKILTY